MRKICTVMTLSAVAALMFLSAPNTADARPQYLKAFIGKYDKVASEAGELKCGVCHGEGGKNKKVVSDYGKALGKALGAKNVKEADDIDEALDQAASQDAGGGKTYGDLLKDGKLPAAAE